MKNETEKLSKFSQMLSKMRKERGISQKKAATDLGISQALLSHYEKGIRECGLDFVIKCSKYYGVTTDYLLGVSESRNGLNDGVLSALDDNEGEIDVNGRMDIGVGRLPVNSLDQATALVDKLIRQIKGESKGKWKNYNIFWIKAHCKFLTTKKH